MKARYIVSAALACVTISAAAFGMSADYTGYYAADVPTVTVRAPARVAAAPQEAPARLEDGPISQAERDAYLLMQIAMAEAESEDVEGKALVMLVVQNRVHSEDFPNTVEGVIYQGNQFAPILDGRFDQAVPDDTCRAALGLIKTGWDGSRGALYFESKSDSTWHADNLLFLFRHGSHYFYR